MSELLVYVQVGFQHIVSLDAADHILFLLVLAAIYRGRDWRAALTVISAFTVGHSITLALAVTERLVLPPTVVEFLIPVTIAATGLENLWHRGRPSTGAIVWVRPLFAGLFGLVHGAGFAGYLQSLFMERIGVPLLGFNLGIEAGQIVVLVAAAIAFRLLDALLHAVRESRLVAGTRAVSWEPFTVRLVSVSVVITALATRMSLERLP